MRLTVLVPVRQLLMLDDDELDMLGVKPGTERAVRCRWLDRMATDHPYIEVRAKVESGKVLLRETERRDPDAKTESEE